MSDHPMTEWASDVRFGAAYLREICGDDDGDLLSDMIEGDLDVENVIGKMIEIIQIDQSYCEAIKECQARLLNRRKRLENRIGRLRTLLASVVAELPGRTYRHALAHVRAFDVDPRLVVTDESAIPAAYWVPQDPKLNEPAVRKHLLQRQTLIDLLRDCRTDDERRARRLEIDRDFPDIPGAALGNAEISVRIRGA